VKLLGNPLMLRVILAVLGTMFACAMAALLVFWLRRYFKQSESLENSRPTAEQLPMQTYHAVIQELKQQKHELAAAQQAERRRAKTSENISSAMLSHVSSGVLFFNPNGLVRHANAACKSILGVASPVGMSAAELFRDTMLTTQGESQTLAAALQSSLHQGTELTGWAERYVSPTGDERFLEVSVIPVHALAGDLLGAACVIDNKTEIATLQKQEALRTEMSAEMALVLHSSLASICGYTRSLAASHDPAATRQFANDVLAEAAQVESTVGSFLAGSKAAGHAAGA